MLNFENILDNSSRLAAEIATNAIGNDAKSFKKVLDLSLNDKPPINWRAARVINLSCLKHYELFEPYVNIVATKFHTFTSAGLKRTYPKIFSLYINKLNEKNKIALIDTCFKYLLSNNEDIAVRVNCMQLIFDLQKDFPEIGEELRLTIELLLLENPKKALKARANMLLKKL